MLFFFFFAKSSIWGFWKYGRFLSVAVEVSERAGERVSEPAEAAMPPRQKHKHEGVGMHI